MTTGDCPVSSTWSWAARLLLLGLLGCSPEYALLETVDPNGSAGGGNPAVSGAGGSMLVGGTAAIGGTAAGGAAAGGAESGGTGSGGYSGGAAGFAGCGGAATSCEGPCAHGFQPVLVSRHGCATCECAPPSECSSNADCQNGEVCYAGQHCADGCSDPSCCFGNQCSPTGCNPKTDACLEFGCSGGGECLAACDSSACECDGASWICANATGGAPIASCPQACAPP